MRLSLTTSAGKSNRILLRPIAFCAMLMSVSAVHAQTTNWTGGENAVWTRPGNWDDGVPSTARIAVVQTGGTGTNLFLREISDGDVAVGTLIFAHDAFRNILGGTNGASAATLNFASTGGIDADIYPAPKGTGLPPGEIGNVVSGVPQVTVSVPAGGTLTVRTVREVVLNAPVVGDASVSFAPLNNAPFPLVSIGSLTQSGYTGGTNVASGITVAANSSSIAGTGTLAGTLASGPLGRGAVTLAGGSLSINAATLGNALSVVQDSELLGGEAWLTGTLNLSTAGSQPGTLIGHRLFVNATSGPIGFANAHYSAADAGTIAITSTAEGNTQFDVDLRMSNGASVFGGAVGEVVNSFPNGVPAPDGSVIKTGTGEFATRHFRVHVMDISAGTLRVNQSSSVAGGTPDFPGSEEGTSRVRRLRLEGVPNPVGSNPPGEANPTVRLDLTNNDLIVDWKGKFSFSPLGTIVNAGTVTSATGYAGALRAAYTGYMGNGTQAWSGTGITSSVAQQNAGSFAIGYAESGPFFNISGDETATFSGQVVSAEAVLFKFTYQGDFTLDGRTNIADFSILAANFNTPQLWTGGDSTYDGLANIADFSQLAANFNAGNGGGGGPQLRGGPPPLAELYLALLDHPQIYWEARLDPSIWWRFEPIEALNLGTIPPVPPSLLARGVPEPSAAVAAGLLAWVRLRRRGVMSARSGATILG